MIDPATVATTLPRPPPIREPMTQPPIPPRIAPSTWPELSALR
jgi:hypothetical protein